MRFIAVILFFMTVCGMHAAENPDSALAAKADRAFANGEWSGASALYMLVSDKNPSASLPYARLIIAQEMRCDSSGSTATMERALANAVPLDSVLEPARTEAFALRRPEIYENYLLRIQRNLTYLRRVIDIRLLRYYTLRRDPDRMAAYSRKMLSGNPDDTEALATLAEAALMTGDTPEAIAGWQKILEIAPDNYEALAALAVLLAPTYPVQAASYARRAIEIRPNTYLEQMFRDL